ncbi:MAG: tetratricopeptide repeat protein, partial [Actinomycetota bacterium]
MTKVLPPTTPPPFLRRSALEARLDDVLSRRLTTVVAGAGAGKSALLAGWTSNVAAAWYTLDHHDAALTKFALGLIEALQLRLPGLPPDISSLVEGSLGPDSNDLVRAEAFTTLLCEVLDDELVSDLVLVLDDVQEIEAGTAAARLIEGLSRQAPARFHVIVSSRLDPPFPVERLRGRGQLLEVDGTMLAFSRAETEELLRAALDESAEQLAGELHELTAGWPVAVRLAIEALRMVPANERSTRLEGLRSPGGPLFTYLVEEVFAAEADEVRELLRKVAPLDRFTPALCEALGLRRATETLVGLARRGLFLKPQSADLWYEMNTLVRDLSHEHLPLTDDEFHTIHTAAAAWFESHGWLEDALRSLSAIGDHENVARILRQKGTDILAAGGPEIVIRASGTLPAELLDASIEQLVGQGLQIRGDWEGALMAFRHAGGDKLELPPGLAWRMGLIHDLGGELD